MDSLQQGANNDYFAQAWSGAGTTLGTSQCRNRENKDVLGVAGAFAQKVTVMNEKFSQTHLKTVTFGSNLPSEIINKIGSIGNHMLVWK